MARTPQVYKNIIAWGYDDNVYRSEIIESWAGNMEG